MKKNKYLHRFVALVMTAVMLLSLVVIDNRIGMKAEDEYTKEVINLETYIPQKVTYKKNKDGSVKTGSVEEVEISVPEETAVTFKGDYLMQELDASDKKQIIATSCDASDKKTIKQASEIEEIRITDSEDEYQYAVYKAADEKDTYEFAGIIRVYGENAEKGDNLSVAGPTMHISAEAGNKSIPQINDKNGDSFYYAEKGDVVSVKGYVSDGTEQVDGYIKQTPEDPADIVKLTYTLNGGNEKEIPIGKDGGAFDVKVPESGSYVFTAYSREGKKVFIPVTIRYTSDIRIQDVTVDEDSELKITEGILGEFLNKKGDGIRVTVSALEDIGDSNFADLDLEYCFVNGTTMNNWQSVCMNKDEDTGICSKTVLIPKSSVAGADYKVIFRVTDHIYESIGTYKFDENGSFVYIDEKAPEITKGSFRGIKGNDSATISIQNYTYDADTWFSGAELTGVAAVEDYAPIDTARISLDGRILETITGISADANQYSYTYDNIPISALVDKSGKHTVLYEAVNRLGQTGTKEITFNLDTKAPQALILSQANGGVSLQDQAEYTVTAKTGETLIFRISDADSQIDTAKTKVYVNGEEVTLTGDELSLPDVGVYKVTLDAYDCAGNTTKKTVTVYVNKETLQDSLTVSSEGKTIDAKDQALVYAGHNGSATTVTYKVTGLDLDADDIVKTVTRKTPDAAASAAGIDVAPSRTDISANGNLKTVTLTYDLTTEGVYAFHFTSKHHYVAANEDENTTDASIQVLYDKTAPSIAAMEFAGAKASADGIYYFSKDPSIHITAEDAFSLGDYKVTDQVGNTILTGNIAANGDKTFDKTLVLTNGIEENKIYTIIFYISDKSGNIATKSNENGVAYRFAVDTEKPAVDIADKESTNSLKLTQYWNGSDVTVKASASDNFLISRITASATCDGKAVADQEQKMNLETEAIGQTMNASFIYKKAGVYEVTVTAYDEVGNTKTAKCTFVIDNELADISFSGIPVSGVYKNDGTQTITVKAADDYGIAASDVVVKVVYETYDYDATTGTGVKGEEIITAKNSSDQTVTATIKNCKVIDGKPMKYYIAVSATDKSGNSSEKRSKTFYYDPYKPEVTVEPAIAGTGTKYYNDKVRFNITVAEQFELGANVYVLNTDDYKNCKSEADYAAKAYKAFSYKDVKQKTFGFTVSKADRYKWMVVAVDASGNAATVSDIRFTIDTEKPLVEIEGVPDDKKSTGTTIRVVITDNERLDPESFKVVECYKYFDGTEYIEKELKIKQVGAKELEASAYCGQKSGKACSYVFKVTGKDRAGNDVEYEINDSRFKVDSTLPDIVLDRYPDSENDGYYNKNVSFKFTVTEQFPLKTKITVSDKNKDVNGDEDETYILNETTGTYTVKRKTPGVYNLTIKAVDAFGNVNYVRDIKFVIDKESPVATIEGVPENGLTQGTNVKITVTDNQKLLLKDFQITEYYKCFDESKYTQKKLAIKKVDGKTLEASAYCGQKKGKACSYYFKVTGTDKAGNKVSYDVAGSRFKVDATKPKVTITPRLEQTNDGYYNKDIAFDIAVEEQFAETHKIVVSDKNKDTNGDADDTFTMKGTSGTYTVKRNAQGIYNLKVTVTDAFGNVTEDEAAFVIDKTKPTIGIATVNKLNNGNVALNVNLADNYKGKSYTVHVKRKDASGAVAYDGDYRTVEWNNTSVNPEIVFSDEGDYEITVSADDKAGNEQIAENVSFRIDKTAPVLSITGVADSQNTSCTATLTVNEAFAFSYDGEAMNSADITATITKKTDGTGASTVATLNTGNFSSGNPHTATYTFDEDGEYTITFNAKDMTGNVATAVTKTFKVDKTAPELKVSAVNSKNSVVNEYETVGGSSVNNTDYVDMNIEVTESFFASNKVNISVQKDGEDVSSSYFTNFGSNAAVSRGSQRFDEDGVYTIAVTAEDALGNKADDYNMVFTVDNTPPTIDKTAKMAEFTERRSEDGELLLNSQDFADIKEKGYDALWSVNDTSVFKASVKLDGIDFVDFSDLTDGYHTMTISVTDEVGHVTTETFDFTYDGTAPRIIITGVDDKSVVRNPFTMKIGLEDADDMLTEIVINGDTIDPALYEDTNSYEFQVENYGNYEVRVSARDTAGNVTSTYDSATDEVFSFQLKEKTSPILIVIIILAILAVVAVILLLIMKKRRNSHSSK